MREFRTKRRLLPLSLCLSLAGLTPLLQPTNARAQEEAEEDKEVLSEARAKFQRGIELEKAGNYAGALKVFREVGQFKMTAQVRYHIAVCEEQLGQLVAALGGYELALEQAEGMHADFLTEVQGSVDDLRARIPKLVIERGEGAEAAAVELDGVALGDSSIGVETPLNPGPHTVTATAPGYEPFRQTVTVSEGAVETLSITLVAKKDDRGSDSDQPGTAPEGKRFGKAPYIIGGAGIGFSVVGGVFIGLSQAKVGKLKDLCGSDFDCSDLEGADLDEAHSLDKGAHTFEALGWVGVGVGVAALATGTVLFVLDSGRSESAGTGVRLAGSAPNSDFGLSLVGKF